MSATDVHFIVNGEDVLVPIGEGVAPLRWLVKRALEISRNTARPVEDFEVRSATGRLVFGDVDVRTLAGQRVFVTSSFGAGGNVWSLFGKRLARLNSQPAMFQSITGRHS